MHWLLLTSLAVLCRAVYGVSTKVLTNRLKVSSAVQPFYLTATGAILALLAAPFLGGISFTGLSGRWDTVTLMTLTFAVGNILYFRAQPSLDAGTTQIAFSSIVIWGTFLSSVLLDSQFSAKQAIGIVILVGAIILIQYRKGQRKVNASVLGIIASAASFAAFQVTSAKISPYASPATYLVLVFGATALFAGIVYAKQIRKETPKLAWRTSIEGLLFSASTTSAYSILAYYAYRVAPDAGVVVVLLTTQVVISVILATIFLRERKHLARKAIATALAFTASVLIKS